MRTGSATVQAERQCVQNCMEAGENAVRRGGCAPVANLAEEEMRVEQAAGGAGAASCVRAAPVRPRSQHQKGARVRLAAQSRKGPNRPSGGREQSEVGGVRKPRALSTQNGLACLLR